MVEDHTVLTPDLCLGEIASYLAKHDVDPTELLRFVSFYHEMIRATPEAAYQAAMLEHRLAMGLRLAIVIAAERNADLMYVKKKRLYHMDPEEAAKHVRASRNESEHAENRLAR